MAKDYYFYQGERDGEELYWVTDDLFAPKVCATSEDGSRENFYLKLIEWTGAVREEINPKNGPPKDTPRCIVLDKNVFSVVEGIVGMHNENIDLSGAIERTQEIIGKRVERRLSEPESQVGKVRT